jgi:hypothetical protein
MEICQPKPNPPTIRGLVKLHKTDLPIRPTVNWRNAPAYSLAKLFVQKIQLLTPLPYNFNIRNSIQLIQELKQTTITATSRFASLDITNMYSNIPVIETKQFLNEALTQFNQSRHQKRNTKLVRSNYKTELLHEQGKHNTTRGWVSYGRPLLKYHIRIIPTEHRTNKAAPPSTKNQTGKLFSICRRLTCHIRLPTHRHQHNSQ